MGDLKFIENSIIVVPTELKKDILKNLRGQSLNNIKVITLVEMRKKFYFDYDNHAVYYLMKKYGYQYDVAKMYLSHLYEVEDNSFGSSKIKKIIDLKNELKDNKLLIYFPNFIEYLKTRTVIFYHCDLLDKLDEKLIGDVSNICKVEIIKNEDKNYLPKCIYEFDTIEDEVVYVASAICKLVEQGISFNQIKLCGASGEYLSIIKRIFNWYHIPISFQDNYLYSTKIGQDFLNHLDDDGVLALKYIEENYSLSNPRVLEIYNKIIQILNKYVWSESFRKVKIFLEE